MRDLGLVVMAGVLLFCAVPGAAAWLQWIALVMTSAVLILIVAGGVTRRRFIARSGDWLCARLGLDAPSMARARRSETAISRALYAREVFARAALMLAVNLTRRLTAQRLRTLGAIAATVQPRFAASLVAGFAVPSAA